jgi:hypothetical protein
MMRDTSDRLVRHDDIKSLRNFERALRAGLIGEVDKAELGLIIKLHGVNSIEYDLYLKSMDAFLRNERREPWQKIRSIGLL